MNQPTRLSLTDRAVRLFQFLGRVQQLKASPQRAVDAYLRDGSVHWLATFPHHPAVHVASRDGEPAPGQPLLTVDRVPRPGPPTPGTLLEPWLDGRLDDADHAPTLRKRIVNTRKTDENEATGDQHLDIVDHPDVADQCAAWLELWQLWADQEQRDRHARDCYSELFSTYVSATAHPEDLELVVGIGCLAWKPDGHPPVCRHLLTVPVAIHFDDDSGRLTVVRVESADGLTVELDMLDPVLTDSQHIPQVRSMAGALEAHPLHRHEVGALARRLVHILDADGEYLDQDERPLDSNRAIAAFAPAILLRRRSQQGLIDIFRTIVEQIEASGEVPDGVTPLLDADHRPKETTGHAPGAVVTVDDELYLPLPVNDRQKQVILRVDRQAQTLVQGPPGTGKTHTAAALLSHLLAQGKRVLVTAHTDRALREVRDKLPAEIRPLSVAVVGSSREDMADLKVAVARIAAESSEHDRTAADQSIQDCLTEIDELARRKAQLYRTLVNAREGEVREHCHLGYRGTLAAMAQQHQAEANRLGWLTDYLSVPAHTEPPTNLGHLAEWRELLLSGDLTANEEEAGRRLVELSHLPEPSLFARLAAAERTAIAADDHLSGVRTHGAFTAIQGLAPDVRADIATRLNHFLDAANALANRRETWISQALADVLARRSGVWRSREQQLTSLIRQVEPLVARVDPTAEVIAAAQDVPVLVAQAKALRQYLDGGGRIKAGPGGAPKIGSLTSKVVKQAQSVFDLVRVNGLPPTTAAELDTFLTWYEAERVLGALDRAWPENVVIPPEDTLAERLHWHVTEHEQLRHVIALDERIAAIEQRMTAAGLPKPDWSDPGSVRRYASLPAAVSAREARDESARPLLRLAQTIAEVVQWSDGAAVLSGLHDSVRTRDQNRYAEAYRGLVHLHRVRATAIRRDQLSTQVQTIAPQLCDAIAADPAATEWNDRLASLNDAWRWASTATWIAEQSNVDINGVQLEITRVETRIRRQVETLAATRAWNHAVAPDRLGGKARADLEQYAFLVRKLGKGTGIHAAQRRADIRRAMDRCRPSVPVWIMPIYRIAEQLRIQPDMFDVVIVDEASQAGLEATFLQYLAPKMVVIGDDKQVSPSAVGMDQKQLHHLAVQYLADDPYIASWKDPQRSLFDESKMRFGGLITLTEHRRCVPEIIGFSNRIAYEPDGVRLIPVRQYGADRLEPIKAVFLADGFTRGTTSKINPVEVEAIVEQIEKCIADPRYDGLTFGVISLLGSAQAKAIEKTLLDRLPHGEWTARDLRCGDSADFQGSERDVVFLSMVAAPDPDRRLTTLTVETYVQRYNVAASRAKDQMWLFHSVGLSDVGSSEGMRFQLLDYCYGVINRGTVDEDGLRTEVVPHDRLVDPFDSLFEQRVFNRIIDRGYSVVPQFPSQGYRLDLVVVGAKARLAVECDGDAWHGPEAYERDLARQRDLERCGWTIFRIRESAFYVDQAAVLADLWQALDTLDIHPSGWLAAEPTQVRVEAEPSRVANDEEPTAIIEWPQAEWSAQVIDDDYPQAADYSATIAVETQPVVDVRTQAEPPAASPLVTSIDSESAVAGTELAPYIAFAGSVPSAADVTTSELATALHAIVATEGPIVGGRLQSVYVRASGGQRVGKLIGNALNRALTSAVRNGLLVEDNPTRAQSIRARTYRLADQPEVRVRARGGRELEEIPPAELGALIADTADSTGWDDEEYLFRTVLARLGLKRLTANVLNQLREARHLNPQNRITNLSD